MSISSPITDGPNDGTTWNEYHASDHFDLFKNPNDVIHFTIGFGASYLLMDVFNNQLHLTKLESFALSVLLVSTIGVVKETWFDNYTSRADIKGWEYGALSGASTFLVIHF